MGLPQLRTTRDSGFSLIQISIILTVGSLLVVSLLPGGGIVSESDKAKITLQRMQAIETATKGFMARNLRRPCPADGTLDTSAANFGVEASNNGQCVGGAPSANFSNAIGVNGSTVTGTYTITGIASTANLAVGMLVSGAGIPAGTRIASINSGTQITLDAPATASSFTTFAFSSVIAGMVPTKSLDLPDEYGLDGYGRRIMYMVDNRATEARACHDAEIMNRSGNVRIISDSTDTQAMDRSMWALVSYGKDGHGAYTMQGSAFRFNAFSVNNNTMMNAFVSDVNMTTSFSSRLVKRTPIEEFDDAVWYQEDTKNTCCQGNRCHLGFTTSLPGGSAAMRVDMADINSDNIVDAIISGGGAQNKVYVLYATKTGWPVTVNAASPSQFPLSSINGTNGFTITNDSSIGSFGSVVVISDINADGRNDFLISGVDDLGGGFYIDSVIVVFGSNAMPANINTSSLNGSNGLRIQVSYSGGSGAFGGMTTGDINGDGYRDIIFSESTNSNTIWTVYSRSAASWASTGGLMTIDTINDTDGFRMNTSDTGNYSIAVGPKSIAAGDVSGDGYGDLIINGGTSGGSGSTYLIFGRPTTAGTIYWNSDKYLVMNGDITTGSEVITGISSTASLFVGQPVVGANIPAGAVIASIDSATQIKLNTIASSTSTVPITFVTLPATINIVPQLTTTPGSAASMKGLRLSGFTTGAEVLGQDVNEDGYTDVIINNTSNTAVAGFGGSGIIGYNGRSGATLYASWPTVSLSGSYSYFIDTHTNRPTWLPYSPTFPQNIVLEDINGDSRRDFLLSGLQDSAISVCGKLQSGTVYVLNQSVASGWGGYMNMFKANNGSCDGSEINISGFRIDGAFSNEAICNIAAGDINKDGKNDILMSSCGAASRQYIFYGRSTVGYNLVEDLANYQ